MQGYTVKQLSDMAKVSIRTLHHYDKIGLLKPCTRTGAGYRLYGEKELLRLQQILFFRELDLALEDIQRILDDPEFDVLEALQGHRRQLVRMPERLDVLLRTIDRTIVQLKTDNAMITPEELYKGFSREEAEAINKEVDEKYPGEVVEESRERMSKMTRREWEHRQQEGEEIEKELASLMDREPSDPQVQSAVGRHYGWINKFYACTKEIYQGLGKLYVSDERFRKHYDKHRPGMADFLNAAMQIYADKAL